MGPDKKENARNEPNKVPFQSWVGRTTGEYTNIIVAGILFLVVMIPLIIMMFIDVNYRKEIVTTLITLFSAFGGFIVGDLKITSRK
jgi:hypothetical protein